MPDMRRFAASLTAIVLTTCPAWAQAEDNVLALGDGTIYSRSLAALTILFVTAVLLENAFATIFNWRVFLTYFSSRGVRTPVMVAISLIVVNAFDLDVLANLIAAYKSAGDPDPNAFAKMVADTTGPTSTFVTALILAGGSAGVHRIMLGLGYRDTAPEDKATSKPPKTEAWVAIKVKRVDAVGDILVRIEAVSTPGAPEAPAALAGTISAQRPSLAELLFRNVSRFPQNGGYSVKPNVPHRITVEGKDSGGTSLTALSGELYVLAPGSIVDLNVTL